MSILHFYQERGTLLLKYIHRTNIYQAQAVLCNGDLKEVREDNVPDITELVV